MSTGGTMKTQTEKIKEFIIIAKDSKKLDSRNRITIPAKILEYWNKLGRCDTIQIAMNRDGEVLLRPATSVPLSEKWLYDNPNSLERVKQGLSDIKKNKVTKVQNLDEFLDSL